jgi:spermidine synthase
MHLRAAEWHLINTHKDVLLKKKSALPDVNFSEYGGVRYLHLGSEWVQGSMRLDSPFEIHLEYVQRMMAWLLLVKPDSVAERHCMQLGLGAGSLTKFCFKKMKVKTTAIEINPQVVAACKLWFKVPNDTKLLSVILGDAAEVVAHELWRAQVDALQVDLYDQEAAAPVLDSFDFYRNCRSLLTEDGVMTVNLFGKNSQFDKSLSNIQEAFIGGSVWCFKPTKEGNTVVMAQKTLIEHSKEELLTRAEQVRIHFGLPAHKWLKVLSQL